MYQEPLPQNSILLVEEHIKYKYNLYYTSYNIRAVDEYVLYKCIGHR